MRPQACASSTGTRRPLTIASSARGYANESGKALCSTSARYESERDFGEPYPGLWRGHPVVTSESELEAPTCRDTVNRGDHRLRRVLDIVDDMRERGDVRGDGAD